MQEHYNRSLQDEKIEQRMCRLYHCNVCHDLEINFVITLLYFANELIITLDQSLNINVKTQGNIKLTRFKMDKIRNNNDKNAEKNIINKSKPLTMSGIINSIQEYISGCAYDTINDQYILKVNDENIKIDKEAVQVIVRYIDDTLFDSLRYALEKGVGRINNSVGLYDVDAAIDSIKRQQ